MKGQLPIDHFITHEFKGVEETNKVRVQTSGSKNVPLDPNYL